MLFTVRAKAHCNEPEYYDADDIYGVIDQLLTAWVEGDTDLPGVFAFLKAEGYDYGLSSRAGEFINSSSAGSFGILDEDVDEGTDEDLLESAANAVRTLLSIGVDDSEIDDAAVALEKLAVFLTAIGDEYQIVEGDDDYDIDRDEAEALEKKLDEDYDY